MYNAELWLTLHHRTTYSWQLCCTFKVGWTERCTQGMKLLCHTHRRRKKIRKQPEKYRSPSKMDWNCVKKEFLLKTCTKAKMVRSFIWPPVMVPLRQIEVSNVDQKLHPASHCPASAGSVCWELQRGTEMFLCSCSLHGFWQETHTDTLLQILF